MANFYPITLEEMEAFLTPLGFKRVPVEGVYEIVFAKRVWQGKLPLSLRIYTGIDESGYSRKKGKDAIRVDLFLWDYLGNDEQGKPKFRGVYLASSKRVHRTEGWRDNLSERINNWLEYMPQDCCPKCFRPMIVRENKQKGTKFLGCTGYHRDGTGCNYTQPIRQ